MSQPLAPGLGSPRKAAPSRTRTISQQVVVRFDYPVHFTDGLFEPDNALFRDTLGPTSGRRAHRLLVVVDDGVASAHPSLQEQLGDYASAHDDLELVSPPLLVPGGETSKNSPGLVESLHEAICTHGLDRHAFVVGIGGGAVLDLAGYAAATAHRGIRHVRVPTTVLAQNDSGVGVKNGVNRFDTKNFLGSFAPPFAVLNDRRFLPTLDDRDWRGGVSEAVKVALLKDPAFFASLEEKADTLRRRDEAGLRAMDEVVYRCAALHLDHIATSGDPFELGSSRPLDFGHWAAHRLESLSRYRLRHGEAVAIGIALDATYSRLCGMLPEADWRRILRLFDRLGLAIFTPRLLAHLHDPGHPRCVLRGLEEFREHLGGELTVTLLEGIGRPVEVHTMDLDLVAQSARLLYELSTTPDQP